MIGLTADRRREEIEALDREIRAEVRRFREIQVGLGRRLLRVRREDLALSLGATTFAIYCEKTGLSSQEGRDLASMAEGAEARPEVEVRVAEGKISVQKAATVAEVLRKPELQKPGEDWLLKAERQSTFELRRDLQKRKEEVRLEEPPVTITVFVSPKGAGNFRRCRELVGRSVGRPVTEGETFEHICSEYLDRHDPERKEARFREKDGKARGNGPPEGKAVTAGLGRSRYIPAVEKREILRTATGDKCQIDWCDNRVWLQNCHRVPFRGGGANRAFNQYRLCKDHHIQHDSGEIRILERPGGALVVNRAGIVVGRLRGPP